MFVLKNNNNKPIRLKLSSYRLCLKKRKRTKINQGEQKEKGSGI